MDQSAIARLERLERQNTRFKIVGILTMLVFTSFLVMGQSTPLRREVRAEKYVLYDSEGRNRGMFFTSPEGQVIFGLAGKNGEPHVTLAVSSDGVPGISLTDNNDKIRAEWTLSKNNPQLAFYSKDEREQMLLDIGADGSPRLALMDNKRTPRIILGSSGKRWVVSTFGPKGEVTGGIGSKK